MKCNDQDQRFLESHGWRVVPAFEMSLDIFGQYPEYFRQSRAEFTVAKDQNVRLRSGWFSERDACYLACGKPVISQETGFSNIMPTGSGLYAFSSIDQVPPAIDRINANYEAECKAARALAHEYFDAKMVAGKMLSDLGL
jgi:hypothetical protein